MNGETCDCGVTGDCGRTCDHVAASDGEGTVGHEGTFPRDETFDRGDTFDLSGEGPSRRRFLHALAAGGGLRRSLERVRDDVPRGEPVVWTRDRRGRPDRVRVVPSERRRRLSVYRSLDVEALRDRYAGVNGVCIAAARRDGDLALQVLVDRAGWTARRTLPSRVRRVPIVVDEREQRPERPPGCETVCDEHIVPFFDPLPAGVQVKGRHDGRVTRDGTLGLVAWNDDPGDPFECFVTAHHVVALESAGEARPESDVRAASAADTAEHLFHSGLFDGEPRAENVGRLRDGSPLSPAGLDVAKYEAVGTVTPATLESVADEQPALSGSWDFAGLADATAAPTDSVPVGFAGRSTCWAESRCTGTERDHVVRWEAVVDPAVADAGDSGGPWVDPDGKLVCTMATGPACDGVDDHHGPVGTALLDRLGVALHPPTVDWPG